MACAPVPFIMGVPSMDALHRVGAETDPTCCVFSVHSGFLREAEVPRGSHRVKDTPVHRP